MPVCLQPMIGDKIKALAAVGELMTAEKAEAPVEYRLYARERDRQSETADQ